jgi:hypothetical protein
MICRAGPSGLFADCGLQIADCCCKVLVPLECFMCFRKLSDEELVQHAKQISEGLNTDEKAELAAEIERRRPGTPERIKEARRQALEKNWLQNGCAKDSSGNWTVPEDLIWRSLPRGEDR